MNYSVQYSENQPQPAHDMNLPQQQQAVGDFINQLPADMSVPSHNEIRIVDQLFHQKKGIFDLIMGKTKDIIVLGGLFIIFSLPFVDTLIMKFVTAASTSPYILIGIKALLFVLTYFIINNLYLARKNK
jgi:hypothetical protein